MEYFLDIAATQHMTHSAKRLHVAQPALSRSLAKLEDELGVKLFHRTGRGLALTDEGRLLEKQLMPIVRDIHRAESMFNDIRRSKESEIRVRVEAASRIASQAFARWMNENPESRLALAQISLPQDDVHVIITSSSSQVDDSIRVEHYTERVMLAAPASVSFQSQAVELAELDQLSFVSLPAATEFSRFVLEMCAHEKFQPRIALESENPSVVRQMIGLGLGVGFWPEKSWGSLEGDAVALHPLANGAARNVYVGLSALGSTHAQAVALFEYLCCFFQETFAGDMPERSSMH